MLEKIKLLIGIKDTSQDDILMFLIDSVISMVKGYCRLSDIPEELDNILIRMTVDMYRKEGYGNAAIPQTIKSETQGSCSITFETTNTDNFLNNYEKLLKPFVNRKGRVPSEIVY